MLWAYFVHFKVDLKNNNFEIEARNYILTNFTGKKIVQTGLVTWILENIFK